MSYRVKFNAVKCLELLCIGTCFLIYKFEFIVHVVEVVDKQYI